MAIVKLFPPNGISVDVCEGRMTYLKIRKDMGFSQASLFSLAVTPLNIGLNACVQS